MRTGAVVRRRTTRISPSTRSYTVSPALTRSSSFGKMEGELVIGKMVPAGRIPVTARAHVEHMVARLVDHFAGVVELELVFAPRVQRLRRRYQHQIVAPAHQIQPRAFGLQHLRRHAVHQHFGHRHLPRNIECHRGQRRGIHLHLDARRHVQREVRGHRGIDAVIACLRIADLRCGILARGARRETGPGVEIQTVLPGGQLPGQNLLDVVRVVDQVEIAQLGCCGTSRRTSGQAAPRRPSGRGSASPGSSTPGCAAPAPTVRPAPEPFPAPCDLPDCCPSGRSAVRTHRR